ncbi:hypothetical protein BY996DRAFT_6598860 [Phakopsora pachyrhizi]|nr:hypothetical protein BY996DRAFT_6598860 [Phakopsora pachyrhizi]
MPIQAQNTFAIPAEYGLLLGISQRTYKGQSSVSIPEMVPGRVEDLMNTREQ